MEVKTIGTPEILHGLTDNELVNYGFMYLSGNNDYFVFACELIRRIPNEQNQWTKTHCIMFNRALHEMEGLLFIGYLENAHPEMLNNGHFNFSSIEKYCFNPDISPFTGNGPVLNN